jgi:hypothetical protein
MMVKAKTLFHLGVGCSVVALASTLLYPNSDQGRVAALSVSVVFLLLATWVHRAQSKRGD